MSILDLRNFTFYYVGSNKPALQDVNLSVDSREIVIMAGPSGCGKSTLLRSINGLIPHMYSGKYSGDVIVDGLKVADTPVNELAKRVGYVFQNPENQIFMFTVERDIAFGLENFGLAQDEMRARVDWAMGLMGISNLALRAPHELSDGQKQRVAIAGVLAMKPKVLILDEPTSLLDPLSAKELIGTVRELHDTLGITIIIVEHRLDLLASIADRIVVLDGGKVLLNGNPRQVLSDPRSLEVGIGVPSMTRLQRLLESSELHLGPYALTSAELSNMVNRILHD